ncbi:MAG: GspE/PulE family protein [Weeksellaceae bacterium]
MDTTNDPIKDLLLKENYVSQEDMDKAAAYATQNKTTLVTALLTLEIINKSILGQAIAESQQVTYADLEKTPASAVNVQRIPQDIAEKFHLVYVREDDTNAFVATDNPQQSGLLDALHNIFNPIVPTSQNQQMKDVKLMYSFTDDITKSFVHYKQPLTNRFADIFNSQNKAAQDIFVEVISEALTYKASDIHFEPQNEEVIVRIRVDGVLQESGRMPKEYYENVLNRVKILAHLRTDEHFSSQDGSVRLATDAFSVDLRVSIVPTLDGEKIVLRVLSHYIKGLGLVDLGLSEKNQQLIEEAITKPFGMILVVGPTGSGKTTTLYALLKQLNKPGVNITTIEDPVEYKIQGVNHIQVNEQTNLTFAKGLRSIVRQDPDIILVGEIRDQETAEIATNAALTGHLLFTTFHANDAATAIPRLLDMKVEPFLLSSTLELIIAQRLVRKICDNCRISTEISLDDIKKNPILKNIFTKKTTLYKGKGCDKCANIGYRGRTAVYEIITVTPEIQELSLTHPSAKQIMDLAIKQGAQTMFADGLEKVTAGLTTIEELMRVVHI